MSKEEAPQHLPLKRDRETRDGERGAFEGSKGSVATLIHPDHIRIERALIRVRQRSVKEL